MKRNILTAVLFTLMLISPLGYANEHSQKAKDIAGTKKSSADKFVDPVTIAAIGESILGYLDERNKATQLEQMQQYLESISSNVKLIQQQNNQILNELAKLPLQMDEANRKDRLSSAYRQLQSYWDAFHLWRQDKWDIGSAANLINAYREVSDLEIDSGRTLELIKWGEFVISISKGGLTPLVIGEVTKKKGTIRDLIVEKESQLSATIATLSGDLKSQYVSNYSVNGNYLSVTWVMSPDRTVKEAYECQCHASCGDQICRTCYKDVIDVAFSGARSAMNSRIDSNVKKIALLQKEIAGLNALSSSILDPYLTVLKADKRFTSIPDDEKVETLNFGGKKDKTNLLKPQPLVPKKYYPCP